MSDAVLFELDFYFQELGTGTVPRQKNFLRHDNTGRIPRTSIFLREVASTKFSRCTRQARRHNYLIKFPITINAMPQSDSYFRSHHCTTHRKKEIHIDIPPFSGSHICTKFSHLKSRLIISKCCSPPVVFSMQSTSRAIISSY